MSAPRTGTPIVLSSLAIAAMLSAAVVGCTRQPVGGQSAHAGGHARMAARYDGPAPLADPAPISYLR